MAVLAMVMVVANRREEGARASALMVFAERGNDGVRARGRESGPCDHMKHPFHNTQHSPSTVPVSTFLASQMPPAFAITASWSADPTQSKE